MHRCVALQPGGGRALLCEPKINPAAGPGDVQRNTHCTFNPLVNPTAHYHILIKGLLVQIWSDLFLMNPFAFHQASHAGGSSVSARVLST